MGYFITEDWFGVGSLTEEDIEILRKFSNVLAYYTGDMELEDLVAANEKVQEAS